MPNQTWFAPIIIAMLLALLPFPNPNARAEAGFSFHKLAQFDLGGDGSWDYLTVDPEARRLYIARSNRVMVIHVDTGKSLGEITGLEGAHGIALVKERGVGFATSGKSGEVLVFDLKNLKILKRIQAGGNPDAIVYDPASRRVFAFNGKTKDITAIEVSTLKVIGTLALPGKPEFAVSDGQRRVFVNVEDQNVLLAINPVQLKIIAQYSLKPCEEPTGLSMDRASQRLIVGCKNRIALIVEANTGHISQTFGVGEGVDATAFDPKHALAFISAGEGRLTILSEDSTGFHWVQDLLTLKSARTLAIDTKSGHVFLPAAQFQPGSRVVVPGTFKVLVEGGALNAKAK